MGERNGEERGRDGAHGAGDAGLAAPDAGRPTRPDRLDLATARSRAARAAAAPLVEDVPLSAAIGRVLAGDLVTPIPLPHYTSSAMDGWAVHGEGPWRLVEGRGEAADGAAPRIPVASLAPGEAAVIVTGGLVPGGTEAVLRSEAGRVVDGRLEAVGEVGREDVSGRRHLRLAGAEAGDGEILLPDGVVLTPPRIALAAATGADRLSVRRRPRVSLVLTGDEVVESGVPAPGHVRDSFSATLPAIIAALGAEVVGVHRVADDVDATEAAITFDPADVVVTTGGTGGSGVDFVRAAVDRLDAEWLVPSVSIRPGGPTFLARTPDRLVLGLPGNPLAAMLGLIAIGGPLFAAATGRPEELAEIIMASAIDGVPGATRLVPVVIRDGRAEPAAHLGTGMMRGLADADAIAVVPAEGVAAEASALALRLPWASERMPR